MGDERRRASLVTRLAVVVCLEWIGATAVLPLLPLYLRTKGATPATTGIVMASFFVAGVVLQYPAGRLADRVGRKPVLIAGLVAYTCACLGFILPLTPIAYGAVRFVQGGAAGAIEVATLATVSLVVPAEQRGRASSRIYAAQLGGAAIGPLLGAFIGVAEMAYVFVLAAGLALLAAAPILRSDLGPQLRADEEMGTLTFDARLVGAIGIAVGFGLIVGAYEACWTLLMHARGASTVQLGLSWMLFAAPFVVFLRVGGWFADHTDRRLTAVAGIVNASVFCAIYPLLGSVDALLCLCSFEAIGSSLALPSAQSMLTEGAAQREVGRRQGVFSTAQTAATAVSAGICGSLFEISPVVPFVTMGAAAIAVALCVPYVWRRLAGRVAIVAITPSQ